MHYVSVCPGCIVSRVALADVSGHGHAVESLGDKLRELMQKDLTAVEQVSLMRDLNEAVMRELDGLHYATMVAVGFHARRGLLVMTNAGHPPGFWFRAKRREWDWFEPKRGETKPGARGTPLGLLPNVTYDRMISKPEPGDIIVLYSDGVSEPPTLRARSWGATASCRWPKRWDPQSVETFGLQLVDAVSQFREGRVPEDDETMIVLQAFPEESRP